MAGFVGSMMAEQFFDSVSDLGEGNLSAQPGDEQMDDLGGDF